MAGGYDQRHDIFYKPLDHVSFKNVRVTVPDGGGTPLTAEASSAVVLDGFEVGAGEGSAVEADGAKSLRIDDCVAPDDGELLARVRGENDGEFSALLTSSYGGMDETVVSVRPETAKR